LHEQEERATREYLNRVATEQQKDSIEMERYVFDHEQPAVAILEQAAAMKADVIAIATHGRRGLPRLFLGSVADKVLRGSALPMLIFRPQEA
jgi:nucleotide-binding universal stress UspA family protein